MYKDKHDVAIGLMGSFIHNTNLGCVALTYSLIQLLEDIANERNREFHYIIFEFENDNRFYELFCEQVKIQREQLEWAPIGKYDSIKSRIKSYPSNKITASAIKKCDFVIDMTLGDSFTDIYGEGRFLWNIRMKEMVEKYKIPLILGPQTYGPFQNPKNREWAIKVINKASLVMARDQLSANYLREFTDKEVLVTTDLAFRLPYTPEKRKENSIKKIGVNISSLLLNNKKEATLKNFNMDTDYDAYIDGLLCLLSKEEHTEIHLIPHVGEDGGSCFATKYPNVIVHDKFTSPIDAKNTIAGMDLFIGSRMHATVAAFSSKVMTIPVGYSRKFVGLYENLGYPYVVDLQKLTTKVALERTKEYLKNEKKLAECQHSCMKTIEELSQKNKQIISDFIFENYRKRK